MRKDRTDRELDSIYRTTSAKIIHAGYQHIMSAKGRRCTQPQQRSLSVIDLFRSALVHCVGGVAFTYLFELEAQRENALELVNMPTGPCRLLKIQRHTLSKLLRNPRSLFAL